MQCLFQNTVIVSFWFDEKGFGEKRIKACFLLKSGAVFSKSDIGKALR
jgi:hypothetical protein